MLGYLWDLLALAQWIDAFPGGLGPHADEVRRRVAAIIWLYRPDDPVAWTVLGGTLALAIVSGRDDRSGLPISTRLSAPVKVPTSNSKARSRSNSRPMASAMWSPRSAN